MLMQWYISSIHFLLYLFYPGGEGEEGKVIQVERLAVLLCANVKASILLMSWVCIKHCFLVNAGSSNISAVNWDMVVLSCLTQQDAWKSPLVCHNGNHKAFFSTETLKNREISEVFFTSVNCWAHQTQSNYFNCLTYLSSDCKTSFNFIHFLPLSFCFHSSLFQ